MRISYATDHSSVQVGLATEGIEDAACRMERHRVHGEIAAA